MKVLLYGYGNPGRQDDGLGNAFVNRMQKWVKKEKIQEVYFDSNYQLNIEDAHEIADKDVVIFVDASIEEIDEFCITTVDEKRDVTFTTHAASPGYVYGLCKEMFGKAPVTYLFHIKGYEWEFKEELTDKALKNMEKALDYCKKGLLQPDILKDPAKFTRTC